MDFNLVFLESLGLNLAITFYMNGILSNFRVKEGKPIFSHGKAQRPMGMFFGEEYGWVSSHSCLTHYKKFEYEGNYVFRPKISYYTGFVDSHELVVVDGMPILNATLFNQMITVTPEEEKDFQVVYTPPYCQAKSEPIDTNHVNGIGLRNGKLRYVTSFTDHKISENKGWKEVKDTGVLFDMIENKPIIQGLRIPHSPRYYKDSLYVCNSGKGELIVLKNGEVKSLYLGSFLRGLSFHGDYAFVGGSKVRESSQSVSWDDITVNECCLYIVDINTLETIAHIDFNKIQDEIVFREIFDISIFPENTVVCSDMSEGYKHLHFV